MNTRVNFKVYRKIDVYAKREGHRAGWQYQHSTNAYPTCRAAAYAAQTNLPGCETRAWFSTKGLDMNIHSFRALSHFENYAAENDAYALDPLELMQFDSYCVAYEFDHISVNSESVDAYARCHVTGLYGETYRYDLVKVRGAE